MLSHTKSTGNKLHSISPVHRFCIQGFNQGRLKIYLTIYIYSKHGQNFFHY